MAKKVALLAAVMGLSVISQGPAVSQPQSTVVRQLEAACSKGDATACFDLGVMYRNGAGVARNDYMAALLFQTACQRGKAAGCYDLGVLYLAGEGVARDDARAAKLFQTACDGGHGGGCNNIGVLYERGQGVARDDLRAVKLYERSCAAGYALGCTNFANKSPQQPSAAAGPQPTFPQYVFSSDQSSRVNYIELNKGVKRLIINVLNGNCDEKCVNVAQFLSSYENGFAKSILIQYIRNGVVEKFRVNVIMGRDEKPKFILFGDKEIPIPQTDDEIKLVRQYLDEKVRDELKPSGGRRPQVFEGYSGPLVECIEDFPSQSYTDTFRDPECVSTSELYRRDPNSCPIRSVQRSTVYRYKNLCPFTIYTKIRSSRSIDSGAILYSELESGREYQRFLSTSVGQIIEMSKTPFAR